MFSGILESDDVLLSFQKKEVKNQNEYPEKRGESVVIKNKKGINQNQVTLLLVVIGRGISISKLQQEVEFLRKIYMIF